VTDLATVRDCMTTRIVTFSPDLDLRQAIRALLRHGISGAPVVDGTGRVVGILSKRDCLKVLFGISYHQAEAGPVSAYMSRDVETVAPDLPLVALAERFLGSTFRRYPVVDRGHLVGIVSRHDVLRALEARW